MSSSCDDLDRGFEGVLTARVYVGWMKFSEGGELLSGMD